VKSSTASSSHLFSDSLPHRQLSSKTKNQDSDKEAISADKITKGIKSELGKEGRQKVNDFMELTKFKLSLLNSIGSFTMFYFHAPLVGAGLLNSSIFFFAT
jgi:hypothetical protein